MAATHVQILNAGEQPVDRTWHLRVASLSATALASDTVGLTAAIYRQSDSRWWSSADSAWKVGREETTLDEDAGLDGLYSADFSPTVMAVTEVDLVVIVSSTDSPDAVAQVSLRHNLRSLPLSDEACPKPIAKLGQLLNFMRAYFGNSTIVNDALKRVQVMQSDGETPAAEWDLQDAGENPSTQERFRQIRRDP